MKDDIQLQVSEQELALLDESMDRFVRSVGGDISRAKVPSPELRSKMSDVLRLGDRISALRRKS